MEDPIEEPRTARELAWIERCEYHPPQSERVVIAHEHARTLVRQVGLDLMTLVPSGAESARMMDALDDVLMYANAAIARRHPDNQPEAQPPA